ncbi:hypothetical protein [Actinomycetospora corticicola]|uniref:Secreted protein n=1 Tax=Actinomycetospora corticicola TaxID=663602 RepID=A0A7Y9DY37_9PSEU|nr:hypothetical protein [Actinomycetospora corticicola]NYD37589.1 hypothetical protein [Actinomycetospora corticicola]
MFRKTVLTTAIIGAGLGSMTGAAFAGDDPGDGGHHGSHDKHSSSQSAKGGCSNEVAAQSKNGSGRSLGDTTGGDQDLSASNLCHILTGNEILSNNNIALPLGTIVNGDTVNRSLTSTNTSDSTRTTTLG